MKKHLLGLLYGARLLLETDDKAVVEAAEKAIKEMSRCPRCRERDIKYQEEILGYGNSPLRK